jgi:hypothetical protein
VRALPAAVTLMDQARARKHDTDLGNRLTDPASGLLGRVLTGGRAAAMEAAGAASQIPADCSPEVSGEGFWSRVDAWAGQPGLTDPPALCGHPGGARGRVMAWPAAGYGVLAAGGRRGEEDEQA